MFASTLLNNLCFCVLLGSVILAANLEDLKKEYIGYILNCAKDYPMTAPDIEKLRNKQVPDNETAKCLLACSYKKAGMMNDQGELSVEGLKDIAQKYLSDDPEQLKKADEFTDACKGVNDEVVSDGTKGCERAALIFKCSVEKAPQFELAS